jgi:hypothetical protein
MSFFTQGLARHRPEPDAFPLGRQHLAQSLPALSAGATASIAHDNWEFVIRTEIGATHT